ncbi:J domain-containing protein [Plasmodiophora brassicae]
MTRDSTCLYGLLGVQPGAPPESIAAGWKQMALKHHPDKGGDAEHFKKVRHAYETLSDPIKRKIYDRFGALGRAAPTEHRKPTAGPTQFSLFNLFRRGAQRTTKASEPTGLPKSPSLTMHFGVTLEEMFNGTSKRITMKRQIPCLACNATGCQPGFEQRECLTCDGVGQRVTQRRVPSDVPGAVVQYEQKQMICPTCDGMGIMIAHDQKCLACKGHRMTPEKNNFVIDIAPGSREGDEIVIEAVGDQLPGHSAADLIVVLQQKPHARFKRTRDDLAVVAKISLLEALTGITVFIKHLDDRWVKVKGEPCLVYNTQSMLAVSGEGMPRKGSPLLRGTLFVLLEIEFPRDNSFTPKQIEILKQVLPPLSTRSDDIPDPTEYAADVASIRMERYAARKKEGEDDDDE